VEINPHPAPIHAIRAVLPGMLASGGGTIVNVSSGAAIRPLEGWSAYCSAKAGLHMLTRGDSTGNRRARHQGVRFFSAWHDRQPTMQVLVIRASGGQPGPARSRGPI